jgi:hypothetical protein
MAFYRSNELSKFRAPSRCAVGSAGPFVQSDLYYVSYVIYMLRYYGGNHADMRMVLLISIFRERAHGGFDRLDGAAWIL